MKTSKIAFFNGIVSAFSRVPAENSSKQCNARTEDGSIRARYGYSALEDPQASFTAVLGFEYLHGYDASFVEKEEYVAFETVSGNTRAYSRHVTTGAATEIKNGGSSVNLNASEWVAATFRSDAYFINPNNTAPVYRHAIGDATSLTAIATPTDPSVAPTYTVTLGGGSTPYTQLSWVGLDPTNATEMACTGIATNTGSALLTDNTVAIRHTGGAFGGASGAPSDVTVTCDMSLMTAGVQDWTYNDIFVFQFTEKTPSFQIDPATLNIKFINNDGSPVTLAPTTKKAVTTAGGSGSGSTGRTHALRIEFTDKTRSLFDNIDKIVVSYRVIAASLTTANNDLVMGKPFVGGIDMSVPVDRTPGIHGLDLYYSYYFSTPGFESGLSPVLTIPNAVLVGYSPVSGLAALGVHLEIATTVSGDANVDNFRLYGMNETTGKYHRIVTQADADLTYDLKMSYLEIVRLTEYEATPFIFANTINMCAHKGACLWMYKGGFQNLKWSRVGDPIRQYSQFDSDEDLNRGATFSLADNFGDEPLGAVSVGRAVLIAGRIGVHYQLGDYPAQMTPPEKVAGSFGVAGKYAYAPWKDDNGNEGMVYVGRNGQVYFAMAGSSSDDTRGGANVLLSAAIREGEHSLKSWLLDGQRSLGLTDYSTAQVCINERDDTLVVIMGKRGIKLRRGNLDGVRSWEPEDYNTGSTTGTIRYLAGSTKYGVRWMRSTGYMDEDQFDNASGQYIEGVKRDGGNPMPQGYWKSQSIPGENRRVLRVYLDRGGLHEAAYVRVHSRRRTQLYKIPAFRHFAKCAPDQQGFEHAFEILVTEVTGRVTLLKWDESPLSRRVTS